jgi:hypothetical protein
MAELIGPLASMTLQPGMMIVFEAIDPNTMAAVAGVKVTNVAVLADTASGADGTGGTVDLTDVAPSFVPVPFGELGG